MVLCDSSTGCRAAASLSEVMSPSFPVGCLEGGDGSSRATSSSSDMSGLHQQPEQAPLHCMNSEWSVENMTNPGMTGACRSRKEVAVDSRGPSLHDHDITDDSLAQLSDDSTFDGCVPCVVASEMVVTTTQSSKRPRKARPRKSFRLIVMQQQSAAAVCCADACCSEGGKRTAAAAAATAQLADATASGDAEEGQQQFSCRPFCCRGGSEAFSIQDPAATAAAAEQRLQDELAAKSRSRMQLKRTDPAYRQLERQRDRERRRCARQGNVQQRQAERARDKEYKRRRRLQQQLSSSSSAALPSGSDGCDTFDPSGVGVTSGGIDSCSSGSGVGGSRGDGRGQQ